MDEREKDFVEEIIDDAKNGLLAEVTWLDIVTGIGYGLGALFVVSIGYINRQANKRATVKLLMNNKEEK